MLRIPSYSRASFITGTNYFAHLLCVTSTKFIIMLNVMLMEENSKMLRLDVSLLAMWCCILLCEIENWHDFSISEAIYTVIRMTYGSPCITYLFRFWLSYYRFYDFNFRIVLASLEIFSYCFVLFITRGKVSAKRGNFCTNSNAK